LREVLSGTVVATSGDAAMATDVGATLRQIFTRAGGPLFAITLILASFVSLALFDLRATKIFSLPPSIEQAGAEDLVAFFRASEMLAEGRGAAAYDADNFREGLGDRHQGMLWLNPPHALLFVAPLIGLPYGAAKIGLIALTALSLVLIARLASAPAWVSVALVVSPAAFGSLIVMQTGPLIALGLLAAMRLAGPRPLLAGVVLALLTMKPQYGLMAPVFLAALGAWRAIGWSAAFTLALAALSVALFGVAPWVAFFESITAGAISAHGANLHRDMLSAGSTLMKIGAGGLSVVGQAATIIACAVLTFFSARGFKRDAAMGLALLASAAASPSLWVYDWPLIAAGLLMLARARFAADAPWPAPLQLAAGLLWFGPLYSLGIATMNSALIAPALLALTIVMAWRWGQTFKGRPQLL